MHRSLPIPLFNFSAKNITISILCPFDLFRFQDDRRLNGEDDVDIGFAIFRAGLVHLAERSAESAVLFIVGAKNKAIIGRSVDRNGNFGVGIQRMEIESEEITVAIEDDNLFRFIILHLIGEELLVHAGALEEVDHVPVKLAEALIF